MTNGATHTPPPPPAGGPPPATPARKKGLSPLAWVGIGCGVLVLLGLVATALLVGWGAKKAGDMAREFEENPGMATAKLMIRANPELELVEADDEAGTVTVRNKETGEVVTVDLADVEEGRISFESDGETVTMGMEEGEDGEGSFTVRDSEGRATFQVGSGGDENVPAWVPRYQGTPPQGAYFASSDGTINGGFSFETTDPARDVLDYYAQALEAEGLTETGRSDTSGGGSLLSSLTFEGDGRTAGVMVTGEEGGTMNVVVTFTSPVEQ